MTDAIVGEYGDYGLAYGATVDEGLFGHVFSRSILVWVHALFTQVLLLNIFVAMLTDSYSMSRERGKRNWNYVRAMSGPPSASTNLCPTPTTLVCRAYLSAGHRPLCASCCCSQRVHP